MVHGLSPFVLRYTDIQLSKLSNAATAHSADLATECAHKATGGTMTIPSRSWNGCVRCRKRRQKCGEQKPQCVRCEKDQVDCSYQKPLRFGGRPFAQSRFGACLSKNTGGARKAATIDGGFVYTSALIAKVATSETSPCKLAPAAGTESPEAEQVIEDETSLDLIQVSKRLPDPISSHVDILSFIPGNNRALLQYFTCNASMALATHAFVHQESSKIQDQAHWQPKWPRLEPCSFVKPFLDLTLFGPGELISWEHEPYCPLTRDHRKGLSRIHHFFFCSGAGQIACGGPRYLIGEAEEADVCIDMYTGCAEDISVVFREIGAVAWERRRAADDPGQHPRLSEQDFLREADLLEMSVRRMIERDKARSTVFNIPGGRDLSVEESKEFLLCNEAYQHTALIHIHRRVRRLPPNAAAVQASVQRIIECVESIRPAATLSPLTLLTTPLFTAGCEAAGPERCKIAQLLTNMFTLLRLPNMKRALQVLEAFWRVSEVSGIDWEDFSRQRNWDFLPY
ncbi:Fungal specific transcription factor domain-containing protein [Cladophialophora immunda]|nr:Fungal specific transcription factor domain-containing protein [Cladophialophora immunda]